jgi:site-specific DNA recombinase
MAVEDFAAEVEREKARQRTHDALIRKAQAGHVPGGRGFGYDQREVWREEGNGSQGRRVRSHVERVINPSEAAVVRQIFELCARGYGVKRIAHTLNADGAPAPLPSRPGRPRGWAPSSVREILYRPLYRGEIVWNRTKRRDAWGVKHQSERPPDDWVRVPAPHLRIVSDELWQAAHARLAASRATYLRGTGGARWGRPPTGIASKYLLTGYAVCAGCGGSLHVRSRSHGARRAYFYGCQTYHLRGPAICANRLEAPMDAANRAVLDTIAHDVLAPAVVEEALALAIRDIREAESVVPDERRALETELSRVEAELGRLVGAIATGGRLEGLLEAVRAREARRAELRRRLTAIEGRRPVIGLDDARLRRGLLARLADWRGLLIRQVSEARPILATLLADRMTFTAHHDSAKAWYEFRGVATLGQVLTGIVLPKGMVAPTGFEPVFQP